MKLQCSVQNIVNVVFLCVEFYLNQCRFPLVIAKCSGVHFLWT